MEIIPSDEYQLDFIGDIDDYMDSNVDVYVNFQNGKKFTATFFTVANITRIMESYNKSGECANGIYFWASDAIIIKNLNPLLIRKAIDDLIKNNEFESAFLEL